jgi:predicted transport protein
LLSGKPSELFQALTKEVLSLDPCVTQEFLKLYIAFKAETNFVDVVPQAKRLLVVLNMSFTELDDPRKMARDVTKLGRWGMVMLKYHLVRWMSCLM